MSKQAERVWAAIEPILWEDRTHSYTRRYIAEMREACMPAIEAALPEAAGGDERHTDGLRAAGASDCLETTGHPAETAQPVSTPAPASPQLSREDRAAALKFMDEYDMDVDMPEGGSVPQWWFRLRSHLEATDD